MTVSPACRPTQRLTIEGLNRRGEGVAQTSGEPIAIPYATPGDIVEAEVHDGRGETLTLITPSLDRVDAFCPWFTRCGGCATQTVALPMQHAWKRDLVASALARAGIEVPVDECIDGHGDGRRRATFHARQDPDGHMQVGFMAARSHDLVAIDHCPLFAPGLCDALPAARAIAKTLASLGKPLDIAVTATTTGLDVDVRGTGPMDDAVQAALVRSAQRLDLARISNHGRTVIAFRNPKISIGAITVELPPGAFLQATQAGEDALAKLVLDATRGAARVADLFCGIGTFALRLARDTDVLAVEADQLAMNALLAAARNASGLRTIRGDVRDLTRRPLSAKEFTDFDAVVFDPPRAGAIEQSRELALSRVPLVVGVSCNPESFARDARVLIEGGYTLEGVTPVDQFRHSAHVEVVGVFRGAKAKKKRSLLG